MALTERDRQRAIRGKGQRTGRCWLCGKPRCLTERTGYRSKRFSWKHLLLNPGYVRNSQQRARQRGS
jgi:hypothetical protein